MSNDNSKDDSDLQRRREEWQRTKAHALATINRADLAVAASKLQGTLLKRNEMIDEDGLDLSPLARRVFRERAMEKQQQQQLTDAEASTAVTRQWTDYIDQRIETVLVEYTKITAPEVRRSILEELCCLFNEPLPSATDDFTTEHAKAMRGNLKRALQARLREAPQSSPPKIILYDPSSALGKRIEVYTEGLRKELSLLREELGLREKSGVVLDLPQLPAKKRA